MNDDIMPYYESAIDEMESWLRKAEWRYINFREAPGDAATDIAVAYARVAAALRGGRPHHLSAADIKAEIESKINHATNSADSMDGLE